MDLRLAESSEAVKDAELSDDGTAGELDDDQLAGGLEEFTDDELGALAIEADPDVELGDDAASLWDLIGVTAASGLPQWYMPAPLAGAGSHPRPRPRWHRRLALLVILSFLVIDAYGLCATYGQLVLA